MQSPANSPPRLRGSSRVAGGFARGRALGNVFNLADANTMEIDDLGPTMGKFFYISPMTIQHSLTLASIKPSGTVKCAVTPTISPVLQAVARKFSPVKGKCLIK
jgi:hypothetical protein